MASRRRTYSVIAPLAAAALLAALPGLARAQQTGAGAATDTTRRTPADSLSGRRDSMQANAPTLAAPTPVADQARGVDAEIRVALFELLHNKDVPALSRLRALQGAPLSLGDSTRAAGALKGREDLMFLLAQSYYRLGLDSSFRSAAQPLAGSARYGEVLRGQLLLDAYRRGDYATARSLAQQLEQSGARGLAALVAGLASYQAGDFAAARTAFGQAQQAGGAYASYARYMDALTLLKADTTQTQQALAAMEQAASGADAEFADQVRLTAAQLAYEAERFPDAARLADQVSANGGLAAQALLTRAWALYKQDDVNAAGEAFTRFATQYPQLPERDEARLMAAQALLQQGNTEAAGRMFRMVADSMNAEVQSLQGRTAQTMSDAARALVQARAAGLLFVGDAAVGKSVALDEAAGADGAALARVVRDTAAMGPAAVAPNMVTLADVTQRLAAVDSGLTNTVPKRVLFSPVSATTARTEYAARSAALYDADVAVALARWELGQLATAQARQLAMLRQLQAMVGADAAAFDTLEAKLGGARDSLGRVAAALDAARVSLRQLLQSQINTTRMLAGENAAALDTVRRAMAGAVSAEDQMLLETEARTIALYQETANLIEAGLDPAISHHPTFALRDSVAARGEVMGRQLAEARGLVNQTQSLIASEIARLEAGDDDRTRGLRSTLAAAEARRTQAEQLVVAVVERELAARAGELLAGLRRDTEAAEFGTASASFFQALDADRGAGRTGSATGSAPRSGGEGAAPVATTTNLPKDKK